MIDSNAYNSEFYIFYDNQYYVCDVINMCRNYCSINKLTHERITV